MNRCPLLFVYGTLRRKSVPPALRRLMQSCSYLGSATIQGKLYDVGRYPALVPSSGPQDLVRGELYKMPNPALVLRKLDVYEGCGPASPAPHEYRRIIQPVATRDGTQTDAWVYVFEYPVAGLRRISSGDYLQYLGEAT